MIRNVAAAIAGLVIAFALVQAIEVLGHAVYPPPNDIGLGDSEQLRTFVSSLPVGGVLFIGAAWAVGALFGTLAGALIAKADARPVVYAVVVGGLVLAGAVAMLIMIPHPWWFTIFAPLAIVVSAYLGMQIAVLIRRPGPDIE